MSETSTATTLGDRVTEEIRAILARRRVSATELARQMGVTQSYLARRMAGVHPLDLDDIQKIADALGVRPLDLFAAADGGATLREPVLPAPRRPVDNRPGGGPGRSPRTSRVRPPYGHAA